MTRARKVKSKEVKSKEVNIMLRRELILRVDTKFSEALNIIINIKMQGDVRRQVVSLINKISLLGIELNKWRESNAISYGATIDNGRIHFPDTKIGKEKEELCKAEINEYFSREEDIGIPIIDIHIPDSLQLAPAVELALKGVINFL